MTDVVIRGAAVHDGSGAPPTVVDVAIEAGRIVAVGRAAGSARRTIDADGLALAPGFIDMHSHADFTLPANREARNSVAQGVTTEVVGNCGFSPAPLRPERAADLARYVHGIGPRLDWAWRSFADYLGVLEGRGVGVNVVALVGHGSLRFAAMGFADRPPSEAELAGMRGELRRALAEGAWGMTTGLVYPPGAYAETDELVSLAEELRPVRGLYASHIRGEAATLHSALDEVFAVGERAGVRVQVSHLKAAGRANWGRLPEAIGRIEAARERGIAVTCDFYPYTAGSTFLSQLLPPWVHEGGVDALVARLRSPEIRARLRDELEHGLPCWQNLLAAAGGWEKVMVASVGDRELAGFEGRTLAEIARGSGADPFELCCDLLVRDAAATVMVIFMMAEEDVRAAARYPNAAVGSDALGVVDEAARVHPRAYGCFARILAWAVRDAGLVSLEEAVRRMTTLPGSILGLADRGRVAPGYAADLVLFEPARVRDMATYEQPNRYPEGVEHVLVNGVFAVDGGRLTGARAGRVLRRA